MVLTQERIIHSVINQVDSLIDSLKTIEELFDLKNGFDLVTQLEEAKRELETLTQVKTMVDRMNTLQRVATILDHVNGNIELGLMAFGVSNKSWLQKTLIVLVKQLYRLMYSNDDM